MTSVIKEYIASEQFIHDDLVKTAEAVVKTVYAIWKKERKIAPVLMTWPAETIRTSRGEPHEGVCILDLPEGNAARSVAIREMVGKTKAFALLLIEQRREDVRVILESRLGARCWDIPISDHGDVKILEQPVVQEGRAHVGLLWSPTMGRG